MESHSPPLMLSILRIAILQVAERGRGSAKGTGTRTGVAVATEIANTTGTEIMTVIVLEGQMAITMINHAGGSLNETTTDIEAMIRTPNLDGMKMNTVLGIVIATGTGTQSAITTEIGIGTEIGTGIEKEREERQTGNGNGETGETGLGEIEIEEREIEEIRIETGRNLIDHRLVNLRLLRHQQLVVTLLDPSSKKCLVLTMVTTVLYLHLQRRVLDLASVIATFLLFTLLSNTYAAFQSKFGLFVCFICIIAFFHNSLLIIYPNTLELSYSCMYSFL